MKKLILLLFIPLVFACSSDEEILGDNTDEINSEVSETEISDIDFTSVNLSATYENQYSEDDITTDKGFEIVSFHHNLIHKKNLFSILQTLHFDKKLVLYKLFQFDYF